MMKANILVEAFDTEKRYLTLGGFYPIRGTSKVTEYLYTMRGAFNTTISWLEWFLLIVYFCTQLSSLIAISEVLLFCMTQSAFVCKLVNFIVQKNWMFVIERHLENPILSDVDEDEEKILNDYVNGVKLLAKIFRLLCIAVVIFYGLYPILDQGSDEIRKLPLPVWVPFDTEKYYFYIWFLILLSLAIGAWTNSNIDILTIMLMTLATAQFEILKRRFTNIIPTTNENVNNNLVKGKIIESIVHFNHINSFVVDLEKTFSNGIFVQFLCSVLVICLTGFQMLVISFKSMQFVLLITYFNCMMCQIIMYCWYGHLLMESSDQITDACYCANWFQCNAPNQRMFVTIMERAKYPVKLRAANFFTLNLTTLMAILRSSYSYFAVLQHIYSNRVPDNVEKLEL